MIYVFYITNINPCCINRSIDTSITYLCMNKTFVLYGYLLKFNARDLCLT